MAPRFCLACDRRVPAWAPGPGDRANARCPLCQALERHRLLALLLRGLVLRVPTGTMVLDVAPHAQVRRVLQRLVGERYVGVDRFEERVVDVWADLTSLPFRSESFGLIVCYHVLEHIPDDAAAIASLRRTLAPGGIALIQVPFREGRPTDEDPSAPEDERIARFGQVDHVRWYGEDFPDRLADGGFAVVAVRPADLLTAEQLATLSIMPDELVWVGCRSEDRQALDEAATALRATTKSAIRRIRWQARIPARLVRASDAVRRVTRRVRRRVGRTVRRAVSR